MAAEVDISVFHTYTHTHTHIWNVQEYTMFLVDCSVGQCRVARYRTCHRVAALKLEHELTVYETQNKLQKFKYNLSIGSEVLSRNET